MKRGEIIECSTCEGFKTCKTCDGDYKGFYSDDGGPNDAPIDCRDCEEGKCPDCKGAGTELYDPRNTRSFEARIAWEAAKRGGAWAAA